jgi:ABC-2 type transport system permease protein
MTLIGKELREILRDGRAMTGAAIVFLLLIVAIAAGAQRVAEEGRRRAAAARAEADVWRNQGERNPHIAAHFGKYALRPMPALALFDPGIGNHAGSAVWIEAHYQNPFSFRPADDATSLLRFGELSPAILFQWLLPLLVIGIGFSMIAGERERGTLRHLLSLGIDPRRLIFAKTGALAIVLAVLMAGAVALAILAATPSLPRLGSDEIVRAAGLAGIYLSYLAIFVAITIAVSARARTARTAITVLLAFWICSTLVIPRLAAEAATRAYPLPANADFWAAIRRDIDRGMDGHNPRDARRKALETKLLAQYRVAKVEDLPINFEGLALEEGERYANQVFDRHYGRLFETFRKREALQQRFAVASPLLALRGLSMALAGTDVAHHAEFARAAELYRRELQTFLNHDMTANARNVAFLDYKRGRAFWDAAPKFAYASPRSDFAIALQHVSLLLLLAWMIAGGALLFRSAKEVSA